MEKLFDCGKTIVLENDLVGFIGPGAGFPSHTVDFYSESGHNCKNEAEVIDTYHENFCPCKEVSVQPSDLEIIKAGRYFTIRFPGGYFVADEAHFNHTAKEISFTRLDQSVGYIDINRIEKVTSSASIVTVYVK